MQQQNQSVFEFQQLIKPPFTSQKLPGSQPYLTQLTNFIKQNLSKQNCNKQLILLTGEPGIGKTALACKLKQQLNINNQYNINIINIVNVIVWYQNEQKLKQILSYLCKNNTIVIFDQFQQLNQPTRINMLEIFKQFIYKSTKTMFILITNNLNKMPILNQDYSYKLSIKMLSPNQQVRQQILQIQCGKQQQYFDKNINYKLIAQKTQGKTPAQLSCIVRQVAMQKVKHLLQNKNHIDIYNLTNQQKQELKSNTQDFIALITEQNKK